jgi:peptide/nickel transport system substrate-binding protein
MTNFGDYALLADTARRLETEYAYNFDKAKEIIDAEMEAMGYPLTDGKYVNADGEQYNVVFLVRNDGDGTRKAWGLYLQEQMEKLGFAVDFREGTGGDLGPIWIAGDPTAGEWHIYTGGWGASVLNRDQSNIFQEMYLPTSAQGLPVFEQNDPDPVFQELGDKLYNREFTTMEQRAEMMAQALELSLQDSLQVMVVDSKQFVPHQEGLIATTDLAAGIESAQITPYTLRWADQEGGTVRWATQPFLFNGPWNPVQGSNTTSDQGAVRMTVGYATTYDPYTGLQNAFWVDKAEVTVQTGLPVQKTLDWVDLKFADEIVVPEDAWADWDAETQTFITVGEKSGGEPVTSTAKSTVYFREDLFDVVKWHDGSNLEMADIMMAYIMGFDRPKEESEIFDQQAVGAFNVFMSTFKGFKIISTDPLIMEGYQDTFSADAELIAEIGYSWINNFQGEGSFASYAMMNSAEAAKELAYSERKALELEVEQTSTIGGPSLDILTAHLDKLIEEETIPYEPTLGQYITSEQAVARYQALKDHFTKYGNYHQGVGPYFLKSVDLNGKSLVMAHWDQYPDLADRWSMYSAPKIAEVEIEAPGQVMGGEEAEFNIYVTFNGKPYEMSDIQEVKFLVYDAENNVVLISTAEAVEDGHYMIKFTGDVTQKFGDGATKLEVAVISLAVAQPTFEAIEFITTQ